jgi:hypothetical protein
MEATLKDPVSLTLTLLIVLEMEQFFNKQNLISKWVLFTKQSLKATTSRRKLIYF